MKPLSEFDYVITGQRPSQQIKTCGKGKSTTIFGKKPNNQTRKRETK